MIQYQVDLDKALETLLYVAQRTGDVYKTLKLIYLADRKSMSRNARLLYGEKYGALPQGPTPDYAYDMLRHVDPKPAFPPFWDYPQDFLDKLKAAVEVRGYSVIVKRDPNIEYLSRSDRAILDETIEEFGGVKRLKDIVHDAAWKSVLSKENIPLENIIESLENSDEVKEYLVG